MIQETPKRPGRGKRGKERREQPRKLETASSIHEIFNPMAAYRVDGMLLRAGESLLTYRDGRRVIFARPTQTMVMRIILDERPITRKDDE